MKLSHSQRNSYLRCPNQYRLERAGYPRKSAFALVAGRALGGTADAIDYMILEGAVPTESAAALLWQDSWELEADKELERNPLEEWRVSGRRSKAWPNKENLGYWLVSGAEMSVAYLKTRLGEEAAGTTTWIDDEGTPGIEYQVDFNIGEDQIRGAADRIMQHADGTLVLRDLKSNQQEPIDLFQLGTYRVGMYENHGVLIDWADYFMFRTGLPSAQPYDMRHWTRGLLEREFGFIHHAKENDQYPAIMGQSCLTCDAKPACHMWGGPDTLTWIDLVPPKG